MHPLISERKSVFPQFFTDRPVERATLEALLEAANQAPSHRKTEPWRFRVYRGAGKEKLKEELLEVYGPDKPDADKTAKKFGGKIDQSAAVLLILLHRDPQESVPEW